ncbi:ethanolamine kinase 1 [Adelges cooleyi]|uniref:ethanolamine kinase 1 n=1 Tax=Adelges cooleyi TaxID=133065 RepID=UPI00217F4A07|nr:ethanolamine kinase 1 [Adelges cooleyi]
MAAAFEQVPHVPICVDGENVESGSRIIMKEIRPDWDLDKARCKLFTDGITNKLVGWFSGDDGVLVRVYGKNTDRHIDRAAECRNFKILNYAGHAPDLYATFDNGIAYKFIEGETLDTITVREPSVYRLVARQMAEFHKVDIGDPWTTKPQVWDKIEQYFNLIPTTFSSADNDERFRKTFPQGLPGLRTEIDTVRSTLENIKSPTVFSHNDLLLTNIIVQRNAAGHPAKVAFIDYEYSMPNYQAFDIANHFIEFAGVQQPDFSLYPGNELRTDWLRIYLEEYLGLPMEPDDSRIGDLKDQVDLFVNLSHILWILWAIVQTEYSEIDFDYIGYGEARYTQYLITKKLLEKVPHK